MYLVLTLIVAKVLRGAQAWPLPSRIEPSRTCLLSLRCLPLPGPSPVPVDGSNYLLSGLWAAILVTASDSTVYFIV